MNSRKDQDKNEDMGESKGEDNFKVKCEDKNYPTDKNTSIENFGAEEESDRIYLQEKAVSPKDRLQFAKWILKGLFLFFLVSIGVWIYRQPCGEILLEICRTGLLPIATFVIGDYFGSRVK